MLFLPKTTRVAMILVIALDVLLIIIPVAQYPRLLTLPHAWSWVLEPLILLLAYGLLISITGRWLDGVVDGATSWGILSGCISAAHIAQENYVHVSASATATLTWIFILGMLMPWVVAGYRAKERGALAGAWSALVCMVVTVTFGWSELFWALPTVTLRNVGSPDLLRSGWTDLHAFAVVDLFQAGFWHLLLGPLIGGLLGGIGCVVRHAIAGQRDSQ